LEKLNLLITELIMIAPEQIFLFNHHQDAISISAIQPFINTSNIMFYHHGDHQLCLGVHLPGVKHIDPHNLGFYNCRGHEKVLHNYYLPLIVGDLGRRPSDHPFSQNGLLRTCSSGTSNKFFIPYKFSYKEFILTRLQIREGDHIHIGDIPDNHLQDILKSLEVLGISRSRFIHIPWSKSVWRSLVDLNVDLYISSFPIGGGRASIEAMGAGIPLLMHENNASSFHGGVDCAYQEAFVWRGREDFIRILKLISQEELLIHSSFARKHYEQYHLPERLVVGIQAILNDEATDEPPKLRDVSPDYLERYLQMRSLILGDIEKKYKNQIDEIERKYSKELRSIYSSRSWKLTEPLRKINSRIHKFFKI
jgi:hypothetical protein